MLNFFVLISNEKMIHEMSHYIIIGLQLIKWEVIDHIDSKEKRQSRRKWLVCYFIF